MTYISDTLKRESRNGAKEEDQGKRKEQPKTRPSTITDQLKYLNLQGSDRVVTETLVTVKSEKHLVPYMQNLKQGHKAISSSIRIT